MLRPECVRRSAPPAAFTRQLRRSAFWQLGGPHLSSCASSRTRSARCCADRKQRGVVGSVKCDPLTAAASPRAGSQRSVVQVADRVADGSQTGRGQVTDGSRTSHIRVADRSQTGAGQVASRRQVADRSRTGHKVRPPRGWLRQWARRPLLTAADTQPRCLPSVRTKNAAPASIRHGSEVSGSLTHLCL